MLRKTIIPVALFAVALLAGACNRFYTNPDFEAKTRNHKTVAILPFEIRITGRLPKDLTEEDKRKIEEGESVAFQKSYKDQVIIVGARGKRELSVTIQPVEKTNDILTSNGISIRDSWNTDPQKLASLLGVDAVIRCKASKHRYLSDLESIGVQVGVTVLSAILGLPGIWGPSRTNDVEVVSTIYAAKDGETLFTGRDEVTVDWSRPANEAIEQVNRRIARRFPYVK